MAIKIAEEEKDITITAEQYSKFLEEYNRSYQYYAGAAPSFESFVRRKMLEESHVNKPLLLNENTKPVKVGFASIHTRDSGNDLLVRGT